MKSVRQTKQKDIKNLTLYDAMDLHEELWSRMADTAEEGHYPRKDNTLLEMAKDGIIQEKDYGAIAFDCFLCQYAKLRYKEKYRKEEMGPEICEFCPVEFTAIPEDGTARPCCMRGTPYMNYDNLDDMIEDGLMSEAEAAKEAALFCRQMAELKPKKES